MALTSNQHWILLFAANQPSLFVGGLPARSGVSAECMEADLAGLERLRFVSVSRSTEKLYEVALAPLGWDYLRDRASSADARAHQGGETLKTSEELGVLIPLKVRPVLRLVV